MATNNNSIFALVFTLISVFLVSIFIHYQQLTIPVVPTNADMQVFSGARAFEQLSQLLREGQSHAVDTPANRIVEQRIVNRLRDLGYHEEIQEGTVCRSFVRGDIKYGLNRCVKARNIIVHIPGRMAGKGILLSAHYDSVPAAPGASDAGAAVATLLEIARLLTLESPPGNSIVLLFNEGEETGLHGAKLFMEQHPLAKQLQVAINIEARGTTSRSVLFETGENSGWLIDQYAKTTPAPLSSSLFYEIYKVLPNDTDLTVYKEHGLQGINFAHADNEPQYHTPLDKLANLDQGSLQHHGDNAWGVLKRIKDMDLNQVKKGNLIYTDIIGLILISWPESISLVLALVLSIVFVAIWFVAYRRQQVNVKTFALAFGLVIVTTLACVALSFLLQWLLQKISGHTQPWRANSLPMEIGVWSLCIATGLGFGLIAQRFKSTMNVLIAIQAWLLILAVGSCIYLPGVSYLLILPLSVSMALTLAALLFVKATHLTLVTFICLPIVIAIIFLPVAYFLEISLGFQASFVIALFVSFIAISFLPLCATAKQQAKSYKWISLVVFLIATIGFVWTAVQAPYTSYKPQPFNLIYFQDNNSAKVVADAMEKYVPPSVSQAIGKTEIGSIFPWSDAKYLYAATDFLNLPEIKAEIVSSNQHEQTRTVTLQLSSSEETSGVTVLIPTDSQLESITVEDQTLGYEDTKPVLKDVYIYQCFGSSCGKQKLKLHFLNLQTTAVTVATFRSGLPASLQNLAKLRDGLGTQRQLGDQTVTVSKVNL